MNRPEFASTAEQAEHIRNEWREFVAHTAKHETETPRTWGFEIETPEADGVRERALDYLKSLNPENSWSSAHTQLSECLVWKQDGSVESADGNNECECDCRACTYHECNCDNCQDYNDSPEHDCGSSDCYNAGEYQEITSLGGLTGSHPIALDILYHADLMSAEINDTCGLHIHLGSADLTPRQVADTIRAYRALGQILDTIAGRANGYYCQKNTDEEATNTARGYGTDKYREVNTAPHFSQHRSAQTIEFRQHAGTNDTAEIRAWAMLLIKITEYAKRGQGIYWLTKCQTLGEALKALA